MPGQTVLLSRIANLFRARSAPQNSITDLGGVDQITTTHDLLRALGSAATIVGKNVSGNNAPTVPAVKAAGAAVEESLATISFNLHQQMPNGDRRRATEHAAHRLVNKFAGEFLSAGRFRAQLAHRAMFFDGFGVALVNRVQGKPYELIPFRPGAVSIAEDRGSGEPIFKLSGKGGGRVLNRRDLIFVPETACDGFKFESTVRRCSDAIALLMVLEELKSRLFKNGTQVPGFFAVDENTTGESATAMKAAFDKVASGVENYGTTPFIPWAIVYHKMGMNNVDSALVEIHNQGVIEVARAFSVPALFLQDLSRATWNNSEAQNRLFYTFTLASWVERFEAAYNSALLTQEERDAGFYIEGDPSSLLMSDPLNEAKATQILIASRCLSPNEWRARHNLNSYEGGDKYENPNTPPGTPPAAEENGDKED